MGKRPHGVPPIHCAARSKRTRERCRRWAVPGAVVCRTHGGGSPQALRLASVRLTLGELSRTDPRPLREIIADAVHLADLAQRDFLSAVQHGQQDAETISRMLESARYAASLAKIALDSGLPLDPEPGAGLVPLNGALSAVVPATMETVRAVIVALLPVHTRDDVAYRSALLDWVPTAMSARVRGEDPPAMPERPPLAEVVSEPPLRAKATHVSPGGIVDAEIVDDDDPDEDLPGDAELLADIERLRAMVAAG